MKCEVRFDVGTKAYWIPKKQNEIFRCALDEQVEILVSQQCIEKKWINSEVLYSTVL